MRRLICILLVLTCSVRSFALSEDKFSSIEDIPGHSIVIYNASRLFSLYGPYMYVEQKGKLKPVKDIQTYSDTFDGEQIFDALSIESYKKKSFLKLSHEGSEYYLLIVEKNNYLDNIRSYSFWVNQLERFKSNYNYKCVQEYSTDVHPSKFFNEITWVGFKMPNNASSDVTFTFIEKAPSITTVENNAQMERSTPADAIKINQSKYITKAQYDQYVSTYLQIKEQEKLDSLADLKPIIAKVRHTYDAKNVYKKADITYDDDDNYQVVLFQCTPVMQYSEIKYKYSGYSLGNELTFNGVDLIFNNSDDANYLQRRGALGLNKRKNIAKESDLAYTKHVSDSLHQESQKILEMLQKIYSFYDKKKVFITGQDYIFGDYGQFGFRFKFYNCYDKEIKYIEIKMVPYNCVDDVQSDDIGRSTKEVRCIGPINKHEDAVYEFEKIWWDDRKLIEYVAVTRIKIIFKDNSSIVFPSKAQVDAHRSSKYSLDDMGIEE